MYKVCIGMVTICITIIPHRVVTLLWTQISVRTTPPST